MRAIPLKPTEGLNGPPAGSFFGEIPIKADAYLLRWVIHDWADENAIAILENVKKAAKPSARLLVMESVIPETAEFDMGKWMDLNMLANSSGGRERTAAEFRKLFDQAGFELEQIIPTPSPLSILVGKLRA